MLALGMSRDLSIDVSEKWETLGLIKMAWNLVPHRLASAAVFSFPLYYNDYVAHWDIPTK